MFLKPFKIKTNSGVKGSDRKKVRAALSSCFPDLTQDELLQVIPSKGDMSAAKLALSSGENITVYSVDKNPVVFEVDRHLLPTVYTLWKHPKLLPTFTTWPQLLEKFINGADLMLPGVVVEGDVTPWTFKHISKGDYCAINTVDNLAPIAMGQAGMSGSDMYDSNMKGKGVIILHAFGDTLWEMGDKNKPPIIPVPNKNDEEKYTEVSSERQDLENNGESAVVGEPAECIGSITDSDKVINDEDDDNGSQKSEKESIEPLPSYEMTTADYDALLDTCFKCAIKSSLKKSDLPILTSVFFRQHMMPYCTPGISLDVKKSSYKKLSKFLHQKEKEEIIKIKEVSKGVDNIVEIDKSHSAVQDFEVPELPVISDLSLNNSDAQQDTFVPPQITQVYSITAALAPFVKAAGYSKGDVVSSSDLRTIFTEYIRTNELQGKEKQKVSLDPSLAGLILNKGENNVFELPWGEVFSRVLGRAQAAYQVEYPGKPPIVHKGKLDGIKLRVEQRASNKKMTIVENVEAFGIDPSDFAHVIQVGVACSSSVVPHQQKGQGNVVLVQGNQIAFIGKLLQEKYQIPKKYVIGLDKAPKGKKK